MNSSHGSNAAIEPGQRRHDEVPPDAVADAQAQLQLLGHAVAVVLNAIGSGVVTASTAAAIGAVVAQVLLAPEFREAAGLAHQPRRAPGALAKKARSRKAPLTADAALVQIRLDQLRQMPVDAIRAQLMDSATYPTGLLVAIATELGIAQARRVGRLALAHQVSMKIANHRGYIGLRNTGK